ncbi:DUF4209 domain-containing protein [Pseudoalteromonas arabiensis]|uniref:DUF4209 domain-containing protein n=1 Tax=Pseudoalteromonas arabiensis TaxID=874454 RepID=UPI000783887B|nr:DUF4209 domain-containing protein [Pseudoalteromonas arabiensis]
MKQEESTINNEVYERLDTKFIVDESVMYSCGHLVSPLLNDAKQKEDEQLVKIYELLKKVCDLKLDPSEPLNPYKPSFGGSDGWEYTQNELDVLSELQAHINSTAFVARINDLCWLYSKPKSKSFSNALKAIDLYSSYAIDGDSWITLGVSHYYRRALRLACQLGKGAYEKVTYIKGKLFNAIFDSYPNSKFMKVWLAELLDDYNLIGQTEFERIEEEFCLLIKGFLRHDEFYEARFYLEFLSKKYYQLKRNDDWVKALIAIAKTWEDEASIREQALAKASLYENAIQAYRKVPNSVKSEFDIHAKLSELKVLHRGAGKQTLAEMVTTKVNVPFPERDQWTASAIEHVSGKDSAETAILYFAGLFHGFDKLRLMELEKEDAPRSFTNQLFNTIRLSHDGRKIAVDRLSDDAELYRDDDRLWSKAVEAAVLEADILVCDCFLPALDELNLQYNISLSMFESLCSVSPVIPSQRSKLFAKGLYFGFQRDFTTAIHLLAPQWEHLVRDILNESGVSTTTMDNKDGITTECGLSTLLSKPESEDIFDDNLLFEMKAFLTDSRGPNIRNNIAHGLFDDDYSSSASCVYWWWRTLKFVLTSLLLSSHSENKN